MRRGKFTWLCGMALPFLALNTLQAEGFPERIHYEGRIDSAVAEPLEGRFDMLFRYFEPAGQEELLAERMEFVEVHQGRFQVELGAGKSGDGLMSVYRFGSLRDLFAAHAEVQVEVSVDGQVYSPKFRILPAGHSLKSRLVLAGQRTDDDGKPHWKHYEAKSPATSVQAVSLEPGESASSDPHGPFLLPMRGPWISQPVRDLPPAAHKFVEPKDAVAINPLRHESLFDEEGNRFGTQAPKVDDPLAAASRMAPSAVLTPPLNLSFEGMSIADTPGYLPPDTEGVVGWDTVNSRLVYIQVVNTNFAMYDSAGAQIQVPTATNTLWSGMAGSPPCKIDNDGDAILMYDQFAQRWVLTQFAVTNPDISVCFAVSTTSDPQGTYYLYELVAQRFPDYYKLGIWPDPINNAYFMGTNSGAQTQYDVYAIDRASLLAGTPPSAAQFFQSYVNLMLPADVEGPDLPPSGFPGLYYTIRDGGEAYFGSPPNDSIDIYEFHVDWGTPANSTYTLVKSFAPPEITDFIWTVCGFFASNCLPQPGTSATIDSASWWPMQRLVYRNFGSYEALVGTWTVDTLATGDHAAPRWFDVRRKSGVWKVYQEGTHSPDGAHRWMPSIAMDAGGNIAIGYSVVDAGNTIYPSIRYATRLASELVGTLQAEASMMVGGGSQTSTSGRWGDYSSMELDPTDDCTFWYTTEYVQTNGTAPWRTRIGSFNLASDCTATTFTLYTDPPSNSVCQGTDAVYEVAVGQVNGYASNVTLSTTGAPAGATVAFSTNPVTPAGLSTMTIGNTAGVIPGSYQFDVVGTATFAKSNRVTLDVLAAISGTPPLQQPTNGATGVSTKPTFQWQADTNATQYTIQIATDAGFTTIVDTAVVLTNQYTPSTALAGGTLHYWRVRSENSCSTGSFSSAFSFTTAAVYCSSPAVAIPDNDPAGVTDDLVIGATGTLTDVNVSIVATHTYVGDLAFTLTHVDTGTAVTIIDRPGVPNSTYGCDLDNIDALLDDEGGAGPVESACPPTGGLDYTPNNPLTAFDGENLSGTWRLKASDAFSGDTGTLDSWCLIPTTSSPATATPTSTPTLTPTMTPTLTPTSTSTLTPTPTSTPTLTPTLTPTFTPTFTPTSTVTSTPTSTPTPTPTSTGIRGDCNSDTFVDAGDLSAEPLEIFDGDGFDPNAVPGGTFAGDPIGCNSNADSVVDAGDLSCTVLLIGSTPCVIVRGEAAGLAQLQIVPASSGKGANAGSVAFDLRLDSGGHDLSALAFKIRFRPTCLGFDARDLDQDGVPDGVKLDLALGLTGAVNLKPGQELSDLEFVIFDPVAPLSRFNDGPVAKIVFEDRCQVLQGDWTSDLGFSSMEPASFGGVQGQSVPGEAQPSIAAPVPLQKPWFLLSLGFLILATALGLLRKKRAFGLR